MVGSVMAEQCVHFCFLLVQTGETIVKKRVKGACREKHIKCPFHHQYLHESLSASHCHGMYQVHHNEWWLVRIIKLKNNSWTHPEKVKLTPNLNQDSFLQCRHCKLHCELTIHHNPQPVRSLRSPPGHGVLYPSVADRKIKLGSRWKKKRRENRFLFKLSS